MKPPYTLLVAGLCLLTLASAITPPLLYEIRNGQIHFISNAPLELIEAESRALKGLIDFDKQTFAFSVMVNSFEGFNSSLQREHFNENYLESDLFPKATFTGRMIEKVDPMISGEYLIRAKGILTMHGIEQERIIRVKLTVLKNRVMINSTFSVPLAQHQITIPKVVQQKIAEEISVEINAEAGIK